MSLKANLFNGKIPKIFNKANFVVTSVLDDIVSNNIVSQQVQAPIIQRVAENGDTDDFITVSELDTGLNSLKSLLLGSDQLSNSLNSIVEINNAINNDPNFYTTITTNIATKANQTSLNTTNTNVAALDTRLDTAESTISGHTSTLSSHTGTLSSHTTSINTINSNVTNLQNKTGAMTYSGNTLTMNENVIVTLDEFLNGNTTIGNASSDVLTVNAGTTFNSTVSGLTKSMVGLGNSDNTSDVNKPVSTAQQTALNLKANLAGPTFTGTVSGITKSMVGLANVDNTSDVNKPVSTAQQTALNLKANQTSLDTTNTNVNALQTLTNKMAFDGTTNTLTMNENVVVNVDEFLNGNTTIGNAGTDTLTVNAASTFVGAVTGLAKTTVGLANVDNTSDVNKPVSTAQQTALNLKSNDSAVCHNTGTETWTGVKTFSSSPIVPTCSANDNSTKVASTAYCDTAITNLIGGAPSSLNSLNELATALSNDANYSTTITTALSGKASLSSDNTFLRDQTFSGDITFGGQDLANRLDTDETNIATLTSKCSAITYDSGTDTTTVNSKMLVTKDVSYNGSINLGDGVNSDVVTLRANISSNAQTVTPTQIGYLSTLSSNAQTQITARALDSATCHNTGTESWGGQKTFSTGITLNGTDLNTRLTTDETNITNLQSKTNAMTFNAGTNTLTMNENVIVNVDEFLNGNTTIGNAGTDTLTVNAASTFVGSVTGLTKTTVGLANVDNTSDANKPVSTAQQTALNLKANLASPTFTGTVSGITKSMVSLGNCDNTSDANKPVSTAQQTALDLKANLAGPTFTGTVSGITKSMVGLGSVDNTSDSGKPVSTAQQTALDLKANLASPTFTGTVSGITKSMVSLGNCDNTSDANKPVSTAQQTALDLKANLASPTFTGTVSGITKSMVSLGNVDNTSDTSKPVSTAQQTALDLKANLASPTLTGTPLCPTASTSDNSTQIASTAFVKAQSYLTTSSASSTYAGLSSNNALTGTNTINMLNENINYVSGVTTSLSLDYSTCKGVNLIATPTANYSLAITNVPTGSTNATYTVTLVTTAKYYVNSITVNGTSRTIYASGGTSNVSVNGSAAYVMQQLNICFLNSSTPVVFSSVLSIW
jgi:hypothetical protein